MRGRRHLSYSEHSKSLSLHKNLQSYVYFESFRHCLLFTANLLISAPPSSTNGGSYSKIQYFCSPGYEISEFLLVFLGSRPRNRFPNAKRSSEVFIRSVQRVSNERKVEISLCCRNRPC